MASALHPKMQLTTRYTDPGPPDAFRFLLRLRVGVTATEITSVYPGAYWKDPGYNWFSGT